MRTEKRKGITLIELVLVIALIGIIIPILTSVFLVGNKSFSTSRDIGFVQQDLRLATIFAENELRLISDISLDIPENNRYYKFEAFFDESTQKSVMRVNYHEEASEVGTEGDLLNSKRITGEWDRIMVSNLNAGRIGFTAITDYNTRDVVQSQTILLENRRDLQSNEHNFSYSKGTGEVVEFYFQKRMDDSSISVAPPGDDTPDEYSVILSGEGSQTINMGQNFTENVLNISGGNPIYTAKFAVVNENTKYTGLDVDVIQSGGQYFVELSGNEVSGNNESITLDIDVEDSNGIISNVFRLELTTVNK